MALCDYNHKLIECIEVTCPSDCSSSPDVCNYSPGCNFGPLDYSLATCVAFELAKALELFQFDFYNDWINGTLFGYLLKYKRKGNKEELFCEYNCDDLGGGGMDGNSNGKSDNVCHIALLGDTCVGFGGDSQKETVGGTDIPEGLVKKYNNELYYAASTKNTAMKLFATELISLGSVFDCDWQGIPKIQPSLIPTTYKIPPDSQENNDAGEMDVSAIVFIDKHNNCGNFFRINCLGLHTDGQQCLNIRHICEMGVNIDETKYDANNVGSPIANCNIGSDDIDDNKGKWFRDVFTKLNSPVLPYLGVNSISSGVLATNFNTGNTAYYDYVSTDFNGIDYQKFRGYGYNHTRFSEVSGYMQPEHSYYFYFGLEPGNTALDKMNAKFFTPCVKNVRDDIVIESNSTVCANHQTNGTITFSFIGGFGPFTYTVTGDRTPQGLPFSYSNTGTAATSNQNVTISGLSAGTYLISGVDNNGVPVSDLITVNGPTGLYCSSFVSANPTGTTGTGSISITSAGGGQVLNSNYNYVLTNSLGNIVQVNGLNISGQTSQALPMVISNLPIDSHSYTMTISDNDTPPNKCITTGLTITGPAVLGVTVEPTNLHCFGVKNGSLKVTVNGGFYPISITVSGMTGSLLNTIFPSDIVGSNGIINNLDQGQYSVMVSDAHGTTAYVHDATTLITCPNPELKIEKSLPNEYSQQCDPTKYIIPFKILSGPPIGTPVECLVSIDNTATSTWISLGSLNNSTGNVYITIPYNMLPISTSGIYIKIKYSNSGLPLCESNIISYGGQSIALPPTDLVVVESTDLTVSDTIHIQDFGVNISQCTPNIAILKLNTSYTASPHLFTGRGPYNVEYKIENGLTQSISVPATGMPTISLTGIRNNTSNPQIIPSNMVKFEVRVTDARGCVSPWFTKNVQVPFIKLIADAVLTASGVNTIHHITASGGTAPYYIDSVGPNTGTPIPTPINALDVLSTSSFYVGTISDSVGCKTMLFK